jgi:hypothetical protein
MSSPIQQIEYAFEEFLSADATITDTFDESIYRGTGNDDKDTPCLIIACERCESTQENTGYFEADITFSVRWPVADDRDEFNDAHGAVYDLLSYPDEIELAQAVNTAGIGDVYLAGAWIASVSAIISDDHWRHDITVTCHFCPQSGT